MAALPRHRARGRGAGDALRRRSASSRGKPGSQAGVALKAPQVLQAPFEVRLRRPFRARRSQDGQPPYVAAGAPWFYTLFGRDALVPALMAGLAGDWVARGALAALGARQASERDDWRDAEPGKLPHEIRRGELAQLNVIPHACYYGTHDAPASTAWRSGALGAGPATKASRRVPADRSPALHWCDEFGDRDGDGLQGVRHPQPEGLLQPELEGLWRRHRSRGRQTRRCPARPRRAQGYLYAARLAIAELLEEGCGETGNT